MLVRLSAFFLATVFLMSFAARAADAVPGPDPHSLANTQDFRVRHLSLDLTADFTHKRLAGYVDLQLQRLDPAARQVVLDTRELTVSAVEQLGKPAQALKFRLGEAQPILGAPLYIDLPASSTAQELTLRVHYQTSPQASGLQWLDPSQTAGKQHPYLYSQSQAIHARSWIPLQDTPQVRLTYDAHIRTPPQLMAVMSAANDPDAKRNGDYRFEMPQAIPSYLIALGVGDLVFKPIGSRTGVYAEPGVVESAAHEFADVESMIEACEKLFGPYRWGRYDLLILPPSFMWGGMENPRLTFLTPTVIAGDRSLVSLIAHELAHSWSGNLVTNANWDSMWLNEGFTVYLERRIIEALYGKERYEMEDVLGLQSLQRDVASLTAAGDGALTRLVVDLKGRDPDDAFSEVPYEKGRLFLGFLESRLGRAELDKFLRGYFDRFAFQSVSTQTFIDYLAEHELNRPSARVSLAEVNVWLDEPGIPSLAVLPHSEAFTRIDLQRDAWLKGQRKAGDLATAKWTTYEWLHFLDNLPADLAGARLGELDAAFHLTASTNAMVAHSWLLDAIRAGYAPAWPRLEQYLTSIGRRKLVKDLYEELLKTPDGKQMAQRIYAKARPLYQIPLVQQLDELIGKPAY
ncbi:M1 family metallopeptidase [Povalibacter sp.]|uniref:M1 family metallopeptidase n=1 Tax=Povalibacter sp. TaxID=1962978 RepID=UPI002F4242F2